MGWVLVTGGAKRLGAAICLELAQAKCDVIVHYNKSEIEAQKTVEKCRSLGVKAEKIHGDLSTSEGVEAFIQRYQTQIDANATQGLVNNVGNITLQPILKTDVETWNALYQTNFFAPMRLIYALLPALKIQKGSIVNIGNAGLLSERANSYASAYMATKQSLLFLTKTLARELASSQVRVNMVSPGILDITIDPPHDLKKIPMQRMGTVDEVARVVRFVMDPSNSYLTGQNIEVSGGFGL